VAVQGSHDADARKHRRAARRRHQDQAFHGGLPLRGLMLGLRKADRPARSGAKKPRTIRGF
jgi:hypothetical protein